MFFNNMEKQVESKEDLVALYSKIDRNIKDRMDSYIVESKLSGQEIKNQKQFLETVIDDYIMRNPIPLVREK
jgi:hypothetical protein